VDPHLFHPESSIEAEYRSGSGFRALMTKNYSKKNIQKNLDQTLIYLSVGLHKLQKKPSAFKRGYPTLLNMIFFLLLLWIFFALLDPDSGSNWGPDL
jgi:hypothetical protein